MDMLLNGIKMTGFLGVECEGVICGVAEPMCGGCVSCLSFCIAFVWCYPGCPCRADHGMLTGYGDDVICKLKSLVGLVIEEVKQIFPCLIVCNTSDKR